MPGSGAAALVGTALTPGAVAPGTFFGQKFAKGELEGFASDMLSSTGTPTNCNHVQPTKLFIGGISRRTTTKQLRDHFSKSGRVLDCVAMRTPDGRPRGFGYVTLDSPAAAERFLAAPQMIDDRIVDMKRAVPEAQTPKAPPGHMMGMMDHAMPMSMQALYSQPTMFYPWSDNSGFYNDGGFGNLSAGDLSMEPQVENDPGMDCLLNQGATGPLLPDCVDLLTGSLLAGYNGGFDENEPIFQEPSVPQHVPEAPLLSTGKTMKAPLGEVTNVLRNASQAITEKKTTPMPFVPATVELKSSKPYQPARIGVGASSPLTSADAEPCFVYEDRQASKASDGGASTEPPSPCDEGDLSPLPPSVDTPVEVLGDADSPAMDDASSELPSLGSALHAAGECRRCNFFAKGRCRNGFNCTFCHLPHDRRKLSRQEKRDLQAARRAQGMESASDSSEDELTAQQSGPLLSPAGARAPPGLFLICEEVKPEDSSAPIVASTSAVSGAALPPGLRPPGLPAPAAQPAAQPQTSKVQPAPLGRLFPWESAGGGLLSTSPCSSSGASSFLLSTTPKATIVQAPSGLPKKAWKETRSVETQTDDDYTCPHCEECGEGLQGVTALLKACDCP